ncbi:MAG: acetate--CoA ligase family protein [bacterium]|nr:acetate--CoA ligase family protein [bacterium]
MEKGVYTEDVAEDFLKKYIPVAKHTLVQSLHEVEQAAKKLGFPLVLKIISPDALHKSEIKGVRFVKDFEELMHEYEDLLSLAHTKKLRLQGILVQEYIEGSYVLIGLKKDPSFGHVLVFGIGGIYTELLKDVSFRVCPITNKDADAMIEELKMKALLLGYRNAEAVNIRLLKKVLVRVSQIPLKHKEIEEMDINPFVINSKRGFVVDARIVV